MKKAFGSQKFTAAPVSPLGLFSSLPEIRSPPPSLPFLIFLKMRRLRALFNLSLLIRSSQMASSSSPLLPPLHYTPSPSVISSFLRGFSTLPASSDPYEVGFVSGHRANRYTSIDEEEEVVRYVPVKAYFLSTSIDLKSLQVENACDVIPPSSRSLNYIALRYSDFPPEITDIGIKENRDHKYSYRYVVVFQYGSAVLFNIADHEAEQYLDIVRKHASGLLPEMRKDDYAVVEKRSLPTWMQGGLDYIVLKSLDIDGIRIIGSVLGQSLALDHYIRQVDDMVEEFTDINRVMEKTGNFDMKRKKLFQLVGKANSNLADVIIRLGLFDRSEIAWKNANYAQILEYLREEYELNQRFGSLDFKLKFVETLQIPVPLTNYEEVPSPCTLNLTINNFSTQNGEIVGWRHNIHFLQEVLQNRRSDLLEWGVIILLTIEIVISMYEIVKEAYVPS